MTAANVHSHQPCMGVPSPAGSLLHLLLVDLCGWPFWLVWCDICCHFVILSVIIRNAVHLVLWAFWVFVCLFVFLRVWGKFTCCSWLLESRLCLEFISAIPTPGSFLRTAVINRPQACELHLQLSTVGQSVVTGNIHKAKAALHAQPCFPGQWDP